MAHDPIHPKLFKLHYIVYNIFLNFIFITFISEFQSLEGINVMTNNFTFINSITIYIKINKNKIKHIIRVDCILGVYTKCICLETSVKVPIYT